MSAAKFHIESCPHCLRRYAPHGPHTRPDGVCKSDAELREDGWAQLAEGIWYRPSVVRSTLRGGSSA